MRRRRRGYLLVLTLGVMGALMVFAAALMGAFSGENSLAQRAERDVIAEEAARAGIQDAFAQILQDPGWNAGFSNVSLPNSGATYSMSFTKAIPEFSTSNRGNTAAVTGYNGRQVPGNTIHLVSVGRFQTSRKVEEALILVVDPYFINSLFAQRYVRLGGSIRIDSFDSSVAPYSAATAGTEANIGVNSGAAGAIEMLSNVSVQGNIMVGPGGTEATSIKKSGSPYYKGFEVMTTPRSIPPARAPVGVSQGAVTVTSGTRALAPGTYSSLSITGATVDLAPGDYVITGNLDVRSQGSLRVAQGPVNIYVLGNISTGGGATFNNTTGKSANMIFWGGSNAQLMDLQGLGGTQSVFALYAPMANLQFGGGTEFYGSFVADSLYVNGNANYHFDKSIAAQQKSEIVPRASW